MLRTLRIHRPRDTIAGAFVATFHWPTRRGEETTNTQRFEADSLAGGPGFEPRLTESESAVLPLNYPPQRPQRDACEPHLADLTRAYLNPHPPDDALNCGARTTIQLT